jgi:hypothetical protein
LTGDRDPFVSLEQSVELLRLLPCAELPVIPGAGHSYDRRFTRAAEDFLERNSIPGRATHQAARVVGHRARIVSTHTPSPTGRLTD